MMMYGPPGTGKSTVARKLAQSLSYRFLTITPSDFISAGPTEIEARAKAIFQMLEEQSDIVILLDEIDRLMLDRDSKRYQSQSDLFQLLTPGMLTKLADLQDRARGILVLATNYRERIDSAILRAGRFDAQCLLLPPETKKREWVLSRTEGFAWPSIPPSIRSEIARRTVLFSFSELALLTTEVTQRQPPDGKRLGQAVLESIAAAGPTISLSSYIPRIKDEGRKPLEEVAMIAYLLLEAEQDLSDDPVVRGAIAEAVDQEIVTEREVVARLSEWLRTT